MAHPMNPWPDRYPTRNWRPRQFWPLVTSLTSLLPQARATSNAPIAVRESSWRHSLASGLERLSRQCSDLQFSLILYSFCKRPTVVNYNQTYLVSRLYLYNVRASETRITWVDPFRSDSAVAVEKRGENVTVVAVWTLCRCWWEGPIVSYRFAYRHGSSPLIRHAFVRRAMSCVCRLCILQRISMNKPISLHQQWANRSCNVEPMR